MSNLTKLFGSIVVLVAMVSAVAHGQQAKPIEKVQGVTGRFQAILTERSPLSNPAEIVKRFAKKPATTDPDYDLSKELFEAFVPKSAGDDGKYGLMVPMPFPGHGFPPATWVDVLEKHHLIWLGDQNGGTTPTSSIGLALDAVHNAEKAWPIDPNRVYICPAGTKSLAQGIALYYPEIFQGQLCSAVGYWFDKVTDSRTRGVYSVDILPRPLPEQMALAKSRTRCFFAGRQDPDPKRLDLMAVLAEQYTRAGFKHVKSILVPPSELTVWSSYPAGWFEKGVEFLDAGAAEANAPAPGRAKPVSAAGPSSPSGTTPPPGASPDDADRKAASALSLAKNYINAGQYETARKKLQTLIETYPKSASAVEAKALLAEIKDK